MNRPELHWLTALRGFAALWVAFHHMGTSLTGISFARLGAFEVFLSRGWLGVDLFFILSGFIISYCYFDKMTNFTKEQAKIFWIKRFARVYPTHLFVLLLFVMVIGGATSLGLFTDTQDKYTFAKLIPQVLLLNGIGMFDHQGWNLPSWSVSSEFLAYLVFPIIPLILKRFTGPVKALIGIQVILSLTILMAYTFNNGQKFMLDFEFSSFRILSEFTMGVLLYRLYTVGTPHKKYLGLALMGFAGILSQSFVTSSFYDFMYLIYFMLIIYGLALVPRAQKIFGLTFLGEISYSLYLVHVLLIILFNQVIRKIEFLQENMLITITLFVITMVISARMLFKFIENPLRKIILQ